MVDAPPQSKYVQAIRGANVLKRKVTQMVKRMKPVNGKSGPAQPADSQKTTPNNCKLQKCSWNSIPPGENDQECIGCEGNKKA
jgi:hypothetical protein